jgi:hypothetical protein
MIHGRHPGTMALRNDAWRADHSTRSNAALGAIHDLADGTHREAKFEAIMFIALEVIDGQCGSPYR